MTPLWTAQAAAQATGGQIAADWVAGGVSIDTRSLQPGDLFVALKDMRDGHDFVQDALAKGAAAALVSHVPDGVSTDKLLIVNNVLEALEALGHAARARITGRVVAITGSVGKTTAKEMLRTALSPQGRTHASQDSYNNHWGVPLSLARMPQDTDFAIIEIGMNAPGEIAPLAKMARPDVAIVTTVAPAHLEAFGHIDGIAHEKGSIFQGLIPGQGIAIANADIDTAPILFDAAKAARASLIGFGETETAQARLHDLHLTQDATSLRFGLNGVEYLVKLPVPGRHFGMNALAVLTAVDAVGGDVARGAMALAHWMPVSGRGTRERIVISPTDNWAIDLIDDAYNANPASIAAGLAVLAAADTAPGGRKLAVLGDMLELGPSAPDLHAGIARLDAMASVDIVHTCGDLMAHLHAALPVSKRGLHSNAAPDLATQITRLIEPGDIIFVKGSKSSQVSRVVDVLRKLGQSDAGKG
jgi:UDP-N-acetylmuramoyl-tripeptide--D-alanyl-D-alanine ligase